MNNIQSFDLVFYSIQELRRKDLFVFGTGSVSERVVHKFARNGIDIYAFLDNDPNRWGNEFFGKQIMPPQEVLKHKNNRHIIVASSFYPEIRQQLNEMGCSENKDYVDVILFEIVEEWERHRAALLPLKEKHKGQRAFLIGNGPSLTVSDLDLLKNENTFGANKIYLAFEETNWRPTYYISMDKMVIKNNWQKIQNLDIVRFLPSSLSHFFSMPEKSPGVFWFPYIEPFREGQKIKRNFSSDFSKVVYDGHTVIYLMMQLAFFMGIKQIYLLGVDFKFTLPVGYESCVDELGVLLKGDGAHNHFHKDYRPRGEQWHSPGLKLQYHALKYARDFLEHHGCQVFNASRKTALDVFPIVDLNRIL
jgi:hypothetical protein